MFDVLFLLFIIYYFGHFWLLLDFFRGSSLRSSHFQFKNIQLKAAASRPTFIIHHNNSSEATEHRDDVMPFHGSEFGFE